MGAAGSKNVGAAAEAAFALFLSMRAAGEGQDFEEFCAHRPQVADSLRLLHKSWVSNRESVGNVQDERPQDKDQSVGEFLRETVGPEADPNVSAGAERSADESTGSLKARLKELTARASGAGRYELLEEIARGGMGVILKVWDRDLRRTLAMKAVLGRIQGGAGGATPFVDIENVGRFLEEAQITGQLDHPGVVPVHELGVDSEGRVFFTMRMVKGRTLDEVIRLARKDEEHWTQTRALNVILRVCEAMAYAHSKGVIHRDLKPANIMVGEFGETYVMDWGLAKVLTAQDSKDTASDLRTQILTDRAGDSKTPDSPMRTVVGTIIGTPAYMPPEQAEGRINDLDQRSDVYSVGALLYTLLTGEMPYAPAGSQATPASVVMKLLGGPPKPVHETDRTVPAELVAICEKAMQRPPDDRYQDMQDMAEDLRAYLERRVVSAYETGAAAEFRKWVVRNKGMAAAVSLLIVLALGGGAFVAWLQQRQIVQLEEAQAAVNEALRQNYPANLGDADASLRLYDARGAKRRLDSCKQDLRGWEWRHLLLKADTSRATLQGHTGKVNSVAFMSDATRLASGADDGTVLVWDLEQGSPVFTLKGPTEPVTSVTVHPQGTRIAAGSQDGLVWLWDANSRLLGTLSGHEASVTSVAFSPDGKRIASGASNGTAHVWDTATRQLLHTVEHTAPVNGVAFRAGGKELVSGADEHVWIWNLATGERRVLRGHEGSVTSVVVSADGTRIASTSFDKTLRLWDAETGQTTAVLSGHSDPVHAAAFSRDGTRLVSGSFDGTLRVWDVDTGAVQIVLLGHDGPVRAVAFDRTGARIASGSADGTIRIWNGDRGADVVVLRDEDDLIPSVDIDPSSQRVLSGSAVDGTLRVRDATTGKEILTIEGKSGGVHCVVFSPDGAWIVAGGEEDSTGRIWNAFNGQPVATLAGHEASVTSIACTPDRKYVVSGSDDHTVRIWDTQTGKCLKVLEEHEDRV
ncbi:MAG: serine/threonine protein kinase, partial [Planctomycetota bacterium]|nr:serine/threonine protein kinase [Planctomycetota bacterium]